MKKQTNKTFKYINKLTQRDDVVHTQTNTDKINTQKM